MCADVFSKFLLNIVTINTTCIYSIVFSGHNINNNLANSISNQNNNVVPQMNAEW